MKKLMWIFAVLLLVLPFFAIGVIAQDDVVKEAEAEKAAAEAVVKENAGPTLGQNLIEFLNSPMGVVIVSGILTFVLGKVFTRKPLWKEVVLKYGPLIMQGVKFAEKQIPDNTENAGLARLNSALDYIIKLEPKLKGIGEGELKQALSAVHATAEANSNLKKD